MTVIIEEKLLSATELPFAELVLPFEQRQKSRLLATLSTGEDAALFLPRGTILRDGDWLRAKDGRIVLVVAQPEKVMQVTCVNSHALCRAAYHLGNRHVPLQIGPGWLRFEADNVLQEMLVGLGAKVEEIEAPFEPEAGAYSSQSHSHRKSTAKIHDHHSGTHKHDHDHDQ
ncbi:MAG TPA: urease accessory protein UreE [Burkholderiales bacterium]|nr:urease accessory protein UreE [Burkholderiales bacterium]